MHIKITLRDTVHAVVIFVGAFGTAFATLGGPITTKVLVGLLPAALITTYRLITSGQATTHPVPIPITAKLHPADVAQLANLTSAVNAAAVNVKEAAAAAQSVVLATVATPPPSA